MHHTRTRQLRILALAPSARGFGYAAMEDLAILECGKKGAKGDKNLRSLSKIEKLMVLFRPGVLVLPDVSAKGSRRAPRIKALHEQVIELATKQNCKVALVSEKKLRVALLGNEKGTKHEIAELLAQRFPAELARKLPPKRRAWDSEDAWMDMFNAVALAVVFLRNRRSRSPLNSQSVLE